MQCHKWPRPQTSPAIKCPSFTSFRTTSYHWGPMYIPSRFKMSEFAANISVGNMFLSLTSKMLGFIRCCNVSLLFLLADVDSTGDKFGQISEVIALNPIFTEFSSKIHGRVMI